MFKRARMTTSCSIVVPFWKDSRDWRARPMRCWSKLWYARQKRARSKKGVAAIRGEEYLRQAGENTPDRIDKRDNTSAARPQGCEVRRPAINPRPKRRIGRNAFPATPIRKHVGKTPDASTYFFACGVRKRRTSLFLAPLAGAAAGWAANSQNLARRSGNLNLLATIRLKRRKTLSLNAISTPFRQSDNMAANRP